MSRRPILKKKRVEGQFNLHEQKIDIHTALNVPRERISYSRKPG